MAAPNFTPIQLYYSTTASAAPTAANLAQGELAINITDGKLYYEDGSGVVQVIASKGAGTIGGSNTQIQYNNAGALAGNAAMTFNSGTNTVTLTTLNLTNALGAIYGGTAQSTYTQGDVLYASAANTLSKLGIGTVNYILTSSGSVPQWSAPSSISVLTATNLAGGVAGSVPYQSAVDTTTFLAIGAANRVMTSTGSAPQWVTSLTSLTGVSSSSITNTSLTSGRVVYSGASGVQTDSANLTFNGTTLSAGGFSTTGLSTLVQTVTIGNSNFNGAAVFAPTTPAKLYIGTGTVTDATSAIGATNATGAISSLAITPIAATNTSVTYTNASTLYIAGAPSAGTNITITNPYSLYVAAGNSYFGGTVTFANSIGALTVSSLTDTGLTSGRVTYASTGGLLADSANLTFDGTVLTVGTSSAFPLAGSKLSIGNDANSALRLSIANQNAGASALVGIDFQPAGGAWKIDVPSDTSGFVPPMYFKAGASTNVTFAYGGNVGIGTSTPSGKLTVNGVINVIDNFALNLGSNQAGGATLLYNTNGNLDITPRSGFSTVFTAGNVGLGTNAPATLFHMLKNGVGGSAPNQPELRIQHNDINTIGTGGSNGGILGFVNLQVDNTGWAANSIWGRINFSCSQPTSGVAQLGASILAAADGAIGGQQSKSYLAFYTSDGSNNGNNQEKLRITSGTNLELAVSQHLSSVYSTAANIFYGQSSSTTGRTNLNYTSLNTNSYEDPSTSAPRFINASSAALRYYQYVGTHVWQTSTATPVADALVNFSDSMTLDASGALMVGATVLLPQTGKLKLVHDTGGQNIATSINSAASNPYGNVISFTGASPNNTTNYFLLCQDSTTSCFTIWSNGTTSGRSDARLKKNIADATPKLNDICQLQVRNYEWAESDGGQKEIGLIAQEVEQVFPGLVITHDLEKDGDDYKEVKYSAFVPILIKAMQEQQALISQLTARITALEGA